MPKMRVIQVSKAQGPLELVEKEIPTPAPGWVRVKIEACGICHSDVIVKDGLFPNIQYPKVPGHEIAGTIDTLGEGITTWKVGQRVGIGWYGGHCGNCDACRRGDFILCQYGKIPGITYDGGYAEYIVAPKEALALIPEEISAVEAAPLLCAGITTFNALRHSKAEPGDTVAVLGIGGLGHLAVQYCAKMGFKTIAIARGADKGVLAKELGAHHYIDSEAENVAQALQKLGGAKVILATVTNHEAINAAVGGLGNNGELIVLGVPSQPLQVSALTLIMGNRSIKGWASGTSIDSQDTMNFSALANVRSMNQVFPLEKAAEAFELMLSGKARFRIVLVP